MLDWSKVDAGDEQAKSAVSQLRHALHLAVHAHTNSVTLQACIASILRKLTSLVIRKVVDDLVRKGNTSMLSRMRQGKRACALQARLAFAQERFPLGGRVRIANPTGKVSEPLTDNNDRLFVFHTEMLPKKAVPMNNVDFAQTVSEHSAWGCLPKKMNPQFEKEVRFLAECASRLLAPSWRCCYASDVATQMALMCMEASVRQSDQWLIWAKHKFERVQGDQRGRHWSANSAAEGTFGVSEIHGRTRLLSFDASYFATLYINLALRLRMLTAGALDSSCNSLQGAVGAAQRALHFIVAVRTCKNALRIGNVHNRALCSHACTENPKVRGAWAAIALD